MLQYWKEQKEFEKGDHQGVKALKRVKYIYCSLWGDNFLTTNELS